MPSARFAAADRQPRSRPARVTLQMEAHQAESASSARLQPAPGNELLDYIKGLSPEELVALTDCASEDVLEAMNQFVQRLMGKCAMRCLVGVCAMRASWVRAP